MNAPAISRRRGARGFTLIEVLISVLIFSVGILGAIAMQAKLRQSTTQNGDRARASMLANEMASQMWAYQTVNPAASTALAAGYAAWQTQVSTNTAQTGLPGDASGPATGTVTYNATTNTSTIVLTWAEPNATTRSSFTTSVVIP